MADGPRLLTAAVILLFFLIVNFLTTYIAQGVASIENIDPFCDSDENVTSCEGVGRENFFQLLATTTFTGFPDWPLPLRFVWGAFSSILLGVAVLLAVSAFIPFLSK